MTAYKTARNTFSNSLPADYDRNDATKVAHAKEQFKPMLHNNNEYMTARDEFKQLYTQYKTIDRDPQYSVIKKLVEIYEFEHLMYLTTLDIIIGIVGEYLS